MMARELKQRIIDTVQSGLNTVQTAMLTQQQFGSTAFYPSTLDQLESVKCGWLRKQGGVVRSWHRRWFVLKGDYLCYYTSEDDCHNGRQPLGSVFLPGNHVTEVLYNPTDTEKFQFEITSGDEGGRVTNTHETYLISAETDDERKEWLSVIKQILYQSVGGAIFGWSLDVTLQYEQKEDKFRKVPQIVENCVEYLRKYGMTEEGLFRLPGRNIVIRQLTDLYDRGKRPSFLTSEPLPDVTLDVHSVASLLKSYIRELPEPLIPFAAYEKVMHVITREKELFGDEQAVMKLNKIMTSDLLPASSYNTMQYVSRFLAQVAAHSDVNKMTSINLATVFVQGFIRPELDDPNLMLATSMQRTVATQMIISNCDDIFTIEYTLDGSSIVLGDLLGLNIDGQDGANDSEPRYHSDLAGLDFTMPEAVNGPAMPRAECVVRRSVVRRSVPNRYKSSADEELQQPPGVKKVNHRAGIVEEDRNESQLQDDVMGSPETNPSAKLNGGKMAFVKKNSIPEVPPRIITAQLRRQKSQSDHIPVVNTVAPTPVLRDHTPVVNNAPVIRPKPATRPRVSVDNSQSTVTTCSDSVVSAFSSQTSTTDSQVEQLKMKLAIVERERDEALARVCYLEQQLQQYQNE